MQWVHSRCAVYSRYPLGVGAKRSTHTVDFPFNYFDLVQKGLSTPTQWTQCTDKTIKSVSFN